MFRTENTLLVEKYRPDSLTGYVGNKSIVDTINSYISKNDVPHLLFAGKAGTGKTTLAKIIANSIDCDYLYVNASDKGGIDFLRTDIIPFASSVGFTNLKLVILDEADYITPAAQAALRNVMETFSMTTRFILTCNAVERIIDPIQSRCQTFKISPPSKKEVALRMVEILNAESIEYDREDLVLIVNDTYPDIRKCINSLQQQSIDGVLKINKDSIIESNYQLKLLEILKNIKDPKAAFVEIRKILSDVHQSDYIDLYSFLYDNIDSFAEGHIAPVILLLAESQYTEVGVVDKELHIASLFVKLLNELN